MNMEKDQRAYIQKRLYFYHFLNDGITFLLPTIMASMYIEFNLTWFQMGLVFAMNSLATVMLQVFVGYFTDKHFTEALMKVGLIFLAFSSLMMIFSFDFWSLLIFATLSGIALAFQHSISYATTSRMYKNNKDIMIGRQGAAGDLGKCTAVFSSAILVIFFASWQLALFSWTVIAFLSFIIITINFKRIKFRDYYHEETEVDKIVLNVSENNMEKSLAILILAAFILVAAIFTLIITNLPTYLRVVKTGLVSELSGLFLGFTLIFGILGAYFSGRVKLRFGMSNSIITISVFLIFTIIIYLILDSSNLMTNLIFYAVLGFFLFIIYPQLLAAINDCFHSKKIGFGYGIMLSFGWIGNFIGSLVGGFLADIYSANVFYVLGIIILIIIIVILGIIKIKHSI